MEVFISWSGSLSHRIALALRAWLSHVIQALQPFVSSEDTAKGVLWFTAINQKLETCTLGIICITKENLHSDWMLFEAGAMAKRLKKSKVCPVLIDLVPTEISSPLSHLQSTTLRQKSEVKQLLSSINKSLPARTRLEERVLDDQFNRLWPELESAVSEAIEADVRCAKLRPRSPVVGLVLPIIYREIDRGELEQVDGWFELVRGHSEIVGDPEIKLAQATLNRFRGEYKAKSMLEQLVPEDKIVYEKAQFELAVLKYSIPSFCSADLVRDWEKINAGNSSLRKLWCSLIGMAFLRESNQAEANRFFQLTIPHSLTDGPIDTYAAVPLAILSAACGDYELTYRYMDIANTGGNLSHLAVSAYPFFPLVRRHDCALVRCILGVKGDHLSDDWITQGKGYSHTLAIHSRVLRACQPALKTIVEMSERKFDKLRIDQSKLSSRLRSFETRLFDKAGKLVWPT